jgi:hypothetical protein
MLSDLSKDNESVHPAFNLACLARVRMVDEGEWRAKELGIANTWVITIDKRCIMQ